jgi:hypothetical protein
LPTAVAAESAAIVAVAFVRRLQRLLCRSLSQFLSRLEAQVARLLVLVRGRFRLRD